MFFPLLNDDSGNQLASPQHNPSAHGWLNIALILVLLAISVGIICMFGAFFSTLRYEFGWNYTTTSALFSLHLLIAGIFSFLSIKTVNNHGTKWIVIIMGIISGLSLFLCSLVEHGWQLFLVYGILLSLSTGTAGITVMSICHKYFQRSIGTSIGVISIGGGLGIAAIFPFESWLISEYGWQDAFLVSSILLWCFMLPSSLFLNETSNDLVDVPDNEPFPNENGLECSTMDRPYSTQNSTNTLNHLLSFGIVFAYSFCLYMVLSHFIPRLEGMDFSAVDAGATLGLMGGAIVFSRLMIGFSGDTLDKKSVAMIFALLHAIALFWLVDSDDMWMFYLFVIVYGATLGGIDFPISAVLGNDMRSGNSDNRLLIVISGWFLGAAAGPLFTGLVFDHTGNYEFAFFFSGIIMVLAAIFIWGMKLHQQQTLESTEVNS